MGSWVEVARDWRDEDDRRCALCGRLVIGRAWIGDDEIAYCEPDCERVHKEYYVPRYGTAA